MTKEAKAQSALKLALEALESSDKLINGTGNHFGLEGAMDGYYSGCFDVEGNNKLLNEAITAIREALAQPEQYSDIVSDGGLDPRNKFDAQLEHPALGSIC